MLERAGDLAAILTNLEAGPGAVHRRDPPLGPTVEEILYPALEDFHLDLVIGQGPAARTLKIDLPRFTLVGATTRAGLITGPLRGRFGIVHRLDFYEPADLATIVRAPRESSTYRSTRAAPDPRSRSRGTPRIANRLLRRVRDFAEVHGDGSIDERPAATLSSSSRSTSTASTRSIARSCHS